MKDLTLDIREVPVGKFAHRKRSNLHRSADRSIRGKADDQGRRPRNPRPDDVVMKAWLERAVRRSQGVFAVDEPQWEYHPDPIGPSATQIAYVRAVLAHDEYERQLFGRGIKVAPHVHYFRYAVPGRVSLSG